MTKLVSNQILRCVISRYISTGNVFCKSREGRFMTKIMKGSSSKKKWQSGIYNSQPMILTATNLARGASEGKQSSNSRRVAVLNKLFMRHITDLMATGENAAEFLGKGIEINRVMVTPDFNGINVYWIAKGTENDEKLETLLIKNSGALRHELSQLRVMGMVPKIYFIKDREFAKLMEVDLRLAKADFGEDYVHVEPSYRFKSELSLSTKLPSHVKEKIESIENEKSDDVYEEPLLPPMRMDVLGLNHSRIMHKVQQSKKKSQGLYRVNTETKLENKLPNTINKDPVEFESNRQQKEAFQQFLLKRQILKAKVDREKNKSYPEYEYMHTTKNELLDDCPLADKFIESDDFIEEPEQDIKL